MHSLNRTDFWPLVFSVLGPWQVVWLILLRPPHPIPLSKLPASLQNLQGFGATNFHRVPWRENMVSRAAFNSCLTPEAATTGYKRCPQLWVNQLLRNRDRCEPQIETAETNVDFFEQGHDFLCGCWFVRTCAITHAWWHFWKSTSWPKLWHFGWFGLPPNGSNMIKLNIMYHQPDIENILLAVVGPDNSKAAPESRKHIIHTASHYFRQMC